MTAETNHTSTDIHPILTHKHDGVELSTILGEVCCSTGRRSSYGVNAMREYSFTEARQNFATILDEAKKEGVVCIKKRDGETFFLKPAPPRKSPLDVKGVDLGLSSTEIVDLIRKGRERQYDS